SLISSDIVFTNFSRAIGSAENDVVIPDYFCLTTYLIYNILNLIAVTRRVGTREVISKMPEPAIFRAFRVFRGQI
ncbi:MAG: hypothetical protein Q8N30_10155, partial [Methylococcales bacterium]|nr:hypothetical protein [Methylococcales bacterium]